MVFNKESEFENALISILFDKGWERGVLQNPTEQDLIDNWAGILFDNNRNIDRLNNCPLTGGEMQQIIEQINTLKTPLKLNSFINGKTVSVKRDNSDKKLLMQKMAEAMPKKERQEFVALAKALRSRGPVRPEFDNYSKIGKTEYHCHLSHHRVACWRREKGTIEIEVYYAGSRENAPN